MAEVFMVWNIFICGSNQTKDNLPTNINKIENFINDSSCTLLGHLVTDNIKEINWITDCKMVNFTKSNFIGDDTDIKYLDNLIRNLKILSLGFTETDIDFYLDGLDSSCIDFIEEFKDIISNNLDDYIYIYIK